jgi:hypothetical protein
MESTQNLVISNGASAELPVKMSGSQRNIRLMLTPYLFVLPAMAFLSIFVLLPLIMSFVLSFTD